MGADLDPQQQVHQFVQAGIVIDRQLQPSDIAQAVQDEETGVDALGVTAGVEQFDRGWAVISATEPAALAGAELGACDAVVLGH